MENTEGRVKHEYLEAENYYENRPVKSGRSTKTCEHCGKSISMGTPHDVHHFYPEFYSYPTHKSCSSAFINSLLAPGEVSDDDEEDDPPDI